MKENNGEKIEWFIEYGLELNRRLEEKTYEVENLKRRSHRLNPKGQLSK